MSLKCDLEAWIDITKRCKRREEIWPIMMGEVMEQVYFFLQGLLDGFIWPHDQKHPHMPSACALCIAQNSAAIGNCLVLPVAGWNMILILCYNYVLSSGQADAFASYDHESCWQWVMIVDHQHLQSNTGSGYIDNSISDFNHSIHALHDLHESYCISQTFALSCISQLTQAAAFTCTSKCSYQETVPPGRVCSSLQENDLNQTISTNLLRAQRLYKRRFLASWHGFLATEHWQE